MHRMTWLVLVIPLLLTIGCGRSDVSSPIEPDASTEDVQISTKPYSNADSNRYLWGLWNVRIAADHQSAEVIPLRVAEMHLNTVRLLEVTPCTDCLTISNLVVYPQNELTADLTLRHPFPGLDKYTGFDVRGILITGSDYTFPISGRKIAWGGDLPRLVNADGYTSLFNPTEFPETNPPALGYIPGKYSTGGDLSATLNPYIAYAEDIQRRMFEAGSARTRTVLLRLPDGPLEFGYAVDACWHPVDGEITDPLTDFPPDANCLEAYRIDVQIGSGLQPEPDSSVLVHVEVYDHQGIDTISEVTIEAPELFSGEVPLNFSTIAGEESYLFTGTISNDIGAGNGEYPLLVRVEDTEMDQNLDLVEAWQVCDVDIGPKKGWARTWGGEESAGGGGVAVDSTESVFVTGSFYATVDFDPGLGTDEHTSNGHGDVYLSKFDSSGCFQNVLIWGGYYGTDTGYDVVIDELGNVYVTGLFGYSTFPEHVDFDPGPGVDEHISNGGGDIFLSKFDADGNFQWARTWGGTGRDLGLAISIDSFGYCYIVGSFEYTVDFDPGPDTDEHTSNGDSDVFLSKFDAENGEFQWACTWGGSGWLDSCNGIAEDALGNIYVSGMFEDNVDFDPGAGIDEHVSNGFADAFLSKFNADGQLQWACTWGGEYSDSCGAVAVDDFGKLYVVGQFGDIVDFDPGPDTEEYASNGYADIFLSKFDSNGVFEWVRVWGGTEVFDFGVGVDVDSLGNVIVTGLFQELVDFDPGLGTDYHVSKGGCDIFLSRFTSNGEFQWARTWGGTTEWDYYYFDEGCSGMAVDASGYSYVTGFFRSEVDFDPGPGIDLHTPNGMSDAFLSKFPPDGNW